MSFITIEDIIKKWTLKLTEMLKNLYRFVGFIIFIGILGNYLVPNLMFNILVIIVIIICGLFFEFDSVLIYAFFADAVFGSK